MKKKTVGIIGYGSIAILHINIILNLFPDFQIIIFRQKNKNKIISKHKQKVIEENLNKIKKFNLDYILITNPSNFHYKNLITNYKRNIDIFIEKPIFDKEYNINNIRKHYKKNNLKLQIGYVFRFDEVVNDFKKLISNKVFSNDTHIEVVCKTNVNKWRRRNNYKNDTSLQKNLGGGVLLELSHEIDYSLFLFGKPNKVFSSIYKSNYFNNSNVEDMANILLIYDSGLIININIEFNSLKESRYCKIYSKNLFLHMDLKKRLITKKFRKKTIIKNYKSKLIDSYSHQLENFLIKKNDKTKIDKDLIDSLNVLKIIKAIKDSNNFKRIIQI